MRLIVLASLLLGSFSAFSACKDPAFQGIEESDYRKVGFHKRFQFVSSGPVAAPKGYPDIFETGDGPCQYVEALVLKHKASGRTYAIYTTHDDSCDGGNTMGIAVDVALQKKKQYQKAIVGHVGDSEFSCEEK